MTPIRLGIAHPSPSAVEVLRHAVEGIPGHVVAWTVRDSDEAFRRLTNDPVTVVMLSVDLQGPSPAANVRRFLAHSRGAVLLVRNTRTDRVEDVYDAMEAGAVDVVDMPSIGEASELRGLSPLVRKVTTAGRLGARRASGGDIPTPSTIPTNSVAFPPSKLGKDDAERGRGPAPALVAIGASTGGPDAIGRVLSVLPRPFPAAVILVQHVDESFAPTIAAWFTQSSGFPVSIAREGERVRVGEALLAGTSDHLRIDADSRLHYVAEPRDYPYRPSVDVFLESVALHHRGTAVGVVLTGMGRDGARGLMSMRRAGHRTIAQDEGSSVIYGMPKAAIEAGAAIEVLDVDRIGDAITRALRAGGSALGR